MPKQDKPKPKNSAAVALAARRMLKISPERRREIAASGGKARWAKRQKG